MLLLGAHVADESLNAFGERGDRLGVALMTRSARLGALWAMIGASGDASTSRRRLDVAGEKSSNSV